MMTYEDITLEKYQVMLHLVNEYAKKHDGVKPEFNYDPKEQTLEIGGISKPIVFQTNKLGLVPAGEYEVVGEVALSKDDTGKTDINGMNSYKKSIVNISNYPEVFDFIDVNHNSTSCACCGTNRERNNFFYIRRMDDPIHEMFQVGSTCVNNYFDRSYFKLMSALSSIANESDRTVIRGKTKDCNLTQYIPAYVKARQKGNSIEDSHNVAVARSIGVTKRVDKSAFQSQVNDILNFYRTHEVRTEHKAIVKTIQEMARVMNGDTEVDPYYSATRCREIAKGYNNLLSYIDNYAIADKKLTIAAHTFTFNDVIDRIRWGGKADSDLGDLKLHITEKGQNLLYLRYGISMDSYKFSEVPIKADTSVNEAIEKIQKEIDSFQNRYNEVLKKVLDKKLAIETHSFTFNSIVDHITWEWKENDPEHGYALLHKSDGDKIKRMYVSLVGSIKSEIEEIQEAIDELQKVQDLQDKKSAIEAHSFTSNNIIDHITWDDNLGAKNSSWLRLHIAKKYKTILDKSYVGLSIYLSDSLDDSINEIQEKIDKLQEELVKAQKYTKAVQNKKSAIEAHSFIFKDMFSQITWDDSSWYHDASDIILHLTDEYKAVLGKSDINLSIYRNTPLEDSIAEIQEEIIDLHDEYLQARAKKEAEDTVRAASKAINNITSELSNCSGINDINYILGDDDHVKLVSFAIDNIGEIKVNVNIRTDNIEAYFKKEISSKYENYIKSRNIEYCKTLAERVGSQQGISVENINCKIIKSPGYDTDAIRVTFTLTDKFSYRSRTGSFILPNRDWNGRGVQAYITRKYTESCERYEQELENSHRGFEDRDR